jgi:molecular chaperone DnaJ
VAERRDYYEILDVSRDADQKAIKDAFRRLALKYHPDRNKEPGAEERFKEIAEAYAVLHDPKKRREYDARGHAGVAGFTPEDLFGGINFDDIFGGFESGFDFGGGLFDRLFRHRRGPRRGANLDTQVFVPMERIVTGGEETVRIDHPVACPACKGSGAKMGTEPRKCSACDGSGRKVTSRKEGGVSIQRITTCPECDGRGEFIDTPCPECGGRGRRLSGETLTVRIPVGAEEGMALRVPDHGMPSEEPGGEPGDLFVIVRTAADARFARRGANLWRDEKVEVTDAVLGVDVVVQTLDGTVTVTVPPGTQPDAVLRLRGKGLPEFGGGRRGDLYLRIDVRIPETVSKEERRLFERLRELRIKKR